MATWEEFGMTLILIEPTAHVFLLCRPCNLQLTELTSLEIVCVDVTLEQTLAYPLTSVMYGVSGNRTDRGWLGRLQTFSP